MKSKIGKKTIAIVMALSMAFSLVACGERSPKPVEITAEVNVPFALSELVEGVSWREFSVKKGDTALSLTSGDVCFPDVGKYTVTRYGTNDVWNITVLDTTAPVVHIIGNYLHIQEDSELAEPRVVVIDNCDGAIENYELTVTHDGADIPVKDGKFTVPTAGDYTLTVSAQDKAGNRGVGTQEFTIDPRVERVAKAGETVTLTPERAKFVLPEGAKLDDYEYTYEVYNNGAETPSTDPQFVMAANGYCIVNITATDKSDESKTYTAHLTYMEEHAHMLTFTGWSTADVHGGKADLWFNPYNQIERTVYADATGISSYSVALKDWENATELPLLCWRIDAIDGTPNFSGAKMDFSYDVYVEGEFAEGKDNSTLYFTDTDGKTDGMPSVTLSGTVGGKFTARKHVEVQGANAIDRGDKVASLFQRFVFKPEDVKANTVVFRIDNFRITPKEKPVISVQNEEIAMNAGEKVIFSADTLGVSSSDFFGQSVKAIEVSEVLKGRDKQSTDISNGDEIILAAEDLFYITLTATDWYGNTQETEVVLYEKGAGITPPVISKVTGKTDIAVDVDTEIGLTDTGIPGYVNVSDDSGEITLTYDKVLKDGVPQKTADGAVIKKFTVSQGEVWEVFMTAADSDGNESKGYIQFIESSIAENFVSFNDDAFTYAGGSVYDAQGKLYAILATPSDAVIYESEYGKKTLRVRYSDTWQFIVVNTNGVLGAPEITNRNGAQYSISVVGECDSLQDTDVLLSFDEYYSWTKGDLGKRLVHKEVPVEFWGAMYIETFTHFENFDTQKGLWLEIDYIALW